MLSHFYTISNLNPADFRWSRRSDIWGIHQIEIGTGHNCAMTLYDAPAFSIGILMRHYRTEANSLHSTGLGASHPPDLSCQFVSPDQHGDIVVQLYSAHHLAIWRNSRNPRCERGLLHRQRLCLTWSELSVFKLKKRSNTASPAHIVNIFISSIELSLISVSQ